MSRIREALNKIEGVSAPPAAAPTVRPTAPPVGPVAPAVHPIEPEAPVWSDGPWSEEGTWSADGWAGQPSPEDILPDIPADFHRELSALRFVVESALPDRATRVVLVTAALGGEGTTTVAANFARILAQDPNQRVLLVDANVRRPGLTLFFGVPAGPGLVELTQTGGGLDGAVQIGERQNLHVLPAQPTGDEGAHLISADGARDFWARHGRFYHWVVVDAAPILEAPETAVLASTVDTTLVVIQAARTKRGVVQRAMDQFAKAGAPVLGAVLNRRRLDIPEFIYRRI